MNNQKKLMQYLTEILHRNEVSLTSFLANISIEEILNHQRLNCPQKTAQLFAVLHKVCHPLLSSAEDDFQQNVKKLKLPEQCQVKAANSFEKDEITLSIRFENFKTFEKAWSEIAKSLS